MAVDPCIKDLNTNETQLYNLTEDIGETTDLSKSLPAKARKVHEQLTAYLEDVNAEKIEDLRAGRRKPAYEGLVREMEWLLWFQFYSWHQTVRRHGVNITCSTCCPNLLFD